MSVSTNFYRTIFILYIHHNFQALYPEENPFAVDEDKQLERINSLYAHENLQREIATVDSMSVPMAVDYDEGSNLTNQIAYKNDLNEVVFRPKTENDDGNITIISFKLIFMFVLF